MQPAAMSSHVLLTLRLLTRRSGTLLEPSCSSVAESVPSLPGTARRGSRPQERAASLRLSTGGNLLQLQPDNQKSDTILQEPGCRARHGSNVYHPGTDVCCGLHRLLRPEKENTEG